MNRFSLVLCGLLLCANTIFAQTIKVSGTVRDKFGPVAGAAVIVQNSTVGTVTDYEGKYEIQAPKNGTLEFSFLGYQTLVKAINGQSTINVEMSDDVKAIDEVVVTAIGIKQQKKKLGYTTQTVSTEALEQPGTLNIGSALSGQIAGLSVDNPTGIFQAPEFTLRGKTPLLVIDGIPVESDLYDISPENIESINVLKGTAASALYGSRGKDGAVLITSKLAKKEGLTITAGLTTMVTAGFTVYPQTQHEFGSGSNGAYEFWDGADGGISDGDMTWGPALDGSLIAQWNSPIRNLETGETIEWYGDVSDTQYDDRTKYERVPIPFVYHDNLGDFLRVGIITKATFSVSNKTEKANINFNANVAHQKGQVPNTSMTTGGLNFNGMFNLSKTVTLSANLSYNKVYTPNYPRYGYGPKNHMYTILLWMSDDVNGKDLERHIWRPDSEGTRQANYNYAWYNNPYFMAYELTQKHDRNTVNGQVKLNWDIIPGLSVQGRFAGRVESTFEDLKTPKSYMNYSASRNGNYEIDNNDQMDVNADALVTYTKAFSKDFAFTANVGTSIYYRQIKEATMATDGLIVPGVYSMANSLNPTSASNSLNEKAIESVYFSLNFDLWNALYLTVTGRNDWSSTLSTENNSYFYPSVSLSTMVNEYITLPSWMDYLKLNAAWAQVSSDLDPYSLNATYSEGVLYGSTASTTYPTEITDPSGSGSITAIVNPNILPQTTTSYEVGISATFLNNRLGFDLTYYHMLDKNSIISLPISAASGYEYRLVNGNKYKTNGFELIITANPIRRRNFNWTLSTNWSSNIQKLTEIYGGDETYGDLYVGDRTDAMYETQWEKSADGKLIMDAETAVFSFASFKTKIGNQNPDVRFGLQNTFKIKDFTVNVDIDGAIGGTLISNTIEKMWWAGKHPKSTMYRQEEYDNGNQAVFVPDAVNIVSGSVEYDSKGNILSDTRTYQKNTTAVNIQTWAQNYPYRAPVKKEESEIFANTYSRTFVKLRRVAISYDLKNLFESNQIKGLELTLFGNNLAVIKDLPYLDPDFGASDGDMQDPSARYIGVSATLKF